MNHIHEPVQARTLSVRLSENLYLELRKIATQKNMSLNALIRQGVGKLIIETHDQEMEAAATLLSQDADSDVEFALAAQAEVVLHGEKIQ